MSVQILDGRIVRDSRIAELSMRAKTHSHPPVLAIIQVGNRPDSTAFISAKQAFAKRIGVAEKHVHLDESISESELISEIEKCNKDRHISGIILQLPLPAHIDRTRALESIDPKKDADGLTAANVRNWLEGRPGSIMPATARGIREMLGHYAISLNGKKVTVIGRSILVGKPIAAMCLNENATVTICHSKTPDLKQETKDADIIIVAAGKPSLIGADHVKKGQIVIDVGITRTPENKIAGDVNFEKVRDIVSAITPVPGGVGPMTVCALFENLLDLASRA